MSGVNKVIILGHLGQNPDLRYMPNGNAVVNFSVATSETWNDQQGQKQERTEWHRMVAYGKLAEIIGKYLQKGSQAYFEGKIATRKWQDKATGADRYTTEIIINEMTMLGGKQNQNQDQGYMPEHMQSNQPSRSVNESRPQSQPQPQSQPSQASSDWDDDIPF